MRQQTKHILFFLVGALLSYAVWKFFFDREPVIQDKPFTKGYSVDQFELEITDEHGEFVAKFISPNLTRYTNSDTVLIDSPNFWTYENNSEGWFFESDSAEYDYKNEQVKLIDNVMAKSLDEIETIELNASDMMVNLSTKIAQTENGVLIQKDTLNLKGQKALFDLTNNQLTVNENVQVVYKSSN